MPRKLSYLPILAIIGLLLSNNVAIAQTESRMAPKGVTQKEVAEFNTAVNQYNNKDFQPASEKFKQLSEAHPDFLDTHIMYGAALLRLGKPEDAIPALHAAENIDPNDGLMIFTLGTAYMLTGKNERAVEKFQKYIRLHPKDQFASESQARVDLLSTEIARNKGIMSSKGQDNYLDEAMAMGAMRWKSSQMPIPIYIAPGQGKVGYRDEFTDILKQAFATWSDASQGKFTYKFVSDPSDSLIECLWSDDQITLANPAEGGQAMPMSSLDGSLMGGRITLLTKKGAQTNLPSNIVRSIALHEVGHMLGMLGHSSQPGDTMLGATSDGTQLAGLSDRDKKTIYLLYTASDEVIKAHPVKTTNVAFQGSQTSPENKAALLTADAIHEIDQKHYTKALELLEEAKKLAPSMEVIYLDLAKIYNELGNEAIKNHDYASVKKNFDLAITNLIKAKRKELAVQYCDIILRIASRDSNSADITKYTKLKRELTGSN